MSSGMSGKVCLGVALVLALPAVAKAQPTVAILTTATVDGVDDELGPSIDRALREQIEALSEVRTQGAAAMSLADIQLALGCEGASPECLMAVAAELGADRLVVPRLARIEDELLLDVSLFDATDGHRVARVERRAPVESVGQLLDAASGVARELFGIVAVEEVPDEGADPIGPPDVVVDPPEESGPEIAIAATLVTLGALTLGGAIGAGVWSQDNASAYATHPLRVEADASAALALLRDAETGALVANVLFVTGGALVVAGAVWLIVELASAGEEATDETAVRVSPFVGPASAGLVIGGRF